jgi:RNA polymerase sigma factor (sigma-70 family)
MDNRQAAALADFLRRVAEPGWAAGLTDGELLERFLARRDEAAFTALVRRHGPAVLGVCRRILHHPQEAEDAFQATFLVLVRSAASIRKRRSVGSWLYGVARRVAVRARGDRARRRQVEQRAPARAAADVPDQATGREFRSVLEEEVRRLPERCRLPFVLCYLEGKTNAEAAEQLGCPKGTVLSRLAHARELLRARLGRRGLGLPAGLAGLAAAEGTHAAALPAPLVAATTRAASVLAGGEGGVAGAIPGRVAELTERTVRAMWGAKLKLAALVVLVAGLVGGGASALAYRALGADRPTEGPPAAQQARPAEARGEAAKPPPPEPDPEAARALDRRKQLEEQHDQLQHTVQQLEEALVALEAQRTKDVGGEEMAAAEEDLRRLERRQALDRERERANIKALEQRMRELRLESWKDPKVKEELKELQAEFDKEYAHWEWAEATRSQQLVKERAVLRTLEERRRQSERRHAIERNTVETKLDAAVERLRELERRLLDPEAPAQPRTDLDRKLDRVLQEMTELRRDLQRRPRQEP